MKFRLLSIITCLVFYSSCDKSNPTANVALLGHAGNGLEISNSIYAPNTKKSTELVLSMDGSNGVELDVQMSKNGTLWLHHDLELDISTNGEDCISTQTDTYLSSVHYSTVNQEKLTRLSDLEVENYLGKTILLDVKHFSPCATVNEEQVVEQLFNFYSQHEDANILFTVNSASWAVTMIEVGLPTYLETIEPTNLADFPNGISGITVKNQITDKEEIAHLQNNGLKVILFNIRAPKTIREALDKSADFLIVEDMRSAIIEKY